MNKFAAVHVHEWGTTVFQFQSELSKDELVAVYRQHDQTLYEANEGTEDEATDTDGMSIAKTLGINFEVDCGETIEIVSLSDDPGPTL